MTIEQAFQLAVQHHEANQLAEAEGLYRQVLAHQPRHAGALHLVGVLAGQVGKFDQAVTLIRQAVAIAPNEPFFHINLGKFLMDGGHLDEALLSYRHAIQIAPTLPEAHSNLGAALFAKQQFSDAETCHREALRLHPNFPEALFHLGNTLNSLGRVDEAVVSYQAAIAANPAFLQAHTNLAAVYLIQRRLTEAMASAQRALQLDPNCAQAHGNLGSALHLMGRLHEAVASFRRCVQLVPTNGQSHANLGNALKELGLIEDAIASFRHALQYQPESPDAHNNLGVGLQLKGSVDEALTCFHNALAFKPDFADGYSNLAYVTKDCGLLAESIAYARKALELNPSDADVRSNLIFALQFDASFTAVDILTECRRWNSLHADPLAKHIQPHTNDPSPDRPLRIGYTSPDFRAHCQAFFTIPLFSHHDRKHFHITAYSDVGLEDELTTRLRSHCQSWRIIRGMPDEQVADLIRKDNIDILVDLTMHMANNRLRVFARKPAPVQVTWLAYPGTTGVDAIDYRLTDPFLDPPENSTHEAYSESSIRLPDTFWCYDPLSTEHAINELPDLSTGIITFGCLNNFCKVNDAVIKLWARVLSAVPKSRLLLLVPQGRSRHRLTQAFQREGIADSRLEFVARHQRRDYLNLYHRIDIGLDTFPYNGHTTSLDSFWMGVPVITLVGPTVVGRAGLCQLMNLQLPELIAHTSEQYIEIATTLAQDLPRLKELRSTLRLRMERSPLMDAPRFARNVEAAYRQIWKTWSTST